MRRTEERKVLNVVLLWPNKAATMDLPVVHTKLKEIQNSMTNLQALNFAS